MDKRLKLIKVNLIIKQVNLSVRFPCSICFSLRNGNHIIEGKVHHQLINGLAKMHDRLNTQVEIQYHNEQYDNKTLFLLITMISSNGKITAGSVEIEITRNGKIWENNQQVQSPISKCPDKVATVIFHKSVEYIRDVPLQSPSNRSDHRKISNTNFLNRQKSNSMLNSNSHYYKSFKGLLSPNNNRFGSPINNLPTSTVRREANEGVEKNKESIYYGLNVDLKSNSDKSEEIPYVTQIKQRKIISANSPKANLSHQISHLPQLSALKSEVQRSKEKYKNSERTAIELENQNRALSQRCEQYRNKFNQYESTIYQREAQIQSQKQTLKDREAQIINLKDVLSDLKMESQAFDRRHEYKQLSYREQLEKITSKCKLLEEQRLQAVQNLNIKIIELEEIERGCQERLREKQLANFQDKKQLNKKIEMFERELEDKSEKLRELEASEQQTTNKLKMQQKKLTDQQEKIEQLIQNLEAIQSQSKKNHEIILSQNKDINELTTLEKRNKSLQSQLSSISIKFNDLDKDYRSIIKKYDKLSEDNKSLENVVKQLKIQKNNQSLKLTMVGRTIEQQQSLLSNKQGEIKKLETSFINVTEQFESFKQSSQQKQSQLQKSIFHYEQTLTQIRKQKQKMYQMAKGNKLDADNIEERYHKIGHQLTQVNRQVIFIEQELSISKDTVMKKSQEVEDLQHEINNLQRNLSEQEKFTKQLLRDNKDKEEKLFELTKNNESLSLKISIANKEAQKASIMYADKIEKKQREVEKLSSTLNRLKKEKEGIQDQVNSLEKDNQANKHEKERTQQRIQLYQENQHSYKKELREQYNIIQELKGSIKELENQETELTTQLRKLREEDNKIQLSCQLNQQINIKGKETVIKAVQEICNQLKKQVTSPESVIKNNKKFFIDPLVDIPLFDAMKKNHESTLALHSKVTFLNETIQYLEKQSKTVSNKHEQTIESLERQIKTLKEANKHSHDDLLIQIEELNEKLIEKEEIVFLNQIEKERIIAENQNKNLLLSEVEQHNQTLTEENQRLRDQIKGLQINQFQHSAQSYSHYPVSLQRKLDHPHTYDQANESRVSSEEAGSRKRELKTIHNLQHQIQALEQSLSSKQTKIGEYQLQKQQLQIKVETETAKIKSLTHKIEEYELKIEKLEAVIVSQAEELSRQVEKHLVMKKKHQEQEYRIEKLQHQVSESNSKYQILHRQYVEIEKTCQQIKQNLSHVKEQHINVISKIRKQREEEQREKMQLRSEIQIKQYLNQQKQQQNKEFQTTIEALETEIQNKKSQIELLQDRVTHLQSQQIQKLSEATALQSENKRLNKKASSLKEKIQQLANDAQENELLQSIIQNKEKQIKRQKDEIVNLEEKTAIAVKQYKSETGELKRENINYISKIEQLKRKCRELEQELEQSKYEAKLSKQRYKESCGKQTKDVQAQLQAQKFHHKSLRNQYENYKKINQKQMQKMQRMMYESSNKGNRSGLENKFRHQKDTIQKEQTIHYREQRNHGAFRVNFG